MAGFNEILVGNFPGDPNNRDDARTGMIKVNAMFRELFQHVTEVNGNTFNMRKAPGNTEVFLQAGDMVLNGFWDANEFWKIAIYLGGDVNVKSNWNIIESI